MTENTRSSELRKEMESEIIASCECGAGLRPSSDWFICPECGEDAKLEV